MGADLSASADLQSFTGTLATQSDRGGSPNTFAVQGTLSPTGELVVNLTSTGINQAGTTVVARVHSQATRTARGTFYSQDGHSQHQDHGTFLLAEE